MFPPGLQLTLLTLRPGRLCATSSQSCPDSQVFLERWVMVLVTLSNGFVVQKEIKKHYLRGGGAFRKGGNRRKGKVEGSFVSDFLPCWRFYMCYLVFFPKATCDPGLLSPFYRYEN